MKSSRLVLLGILLLAFGLRSYHLGFQSIWTDEGFVFGLASRSLSELIAVWNISPQEGYASLSRLGQDLAGLAVETDIHPPLYYFLVHFWMDVAGRSEFALRFPSVFFGALTLPLMYAWGKRLAGSGAALIACGLGALSPFYLDFSQQVRMYTLVTFLAVLSMYCFHRAFTDGRRLHWIGYTLSICLALYTHYFAITVVLVQGLLAVTSLRSRRDLARSGYWLASAGGAAILLAPWAPFALRQVFDYQNHSLLAPNWQTVFYSTWQTFNLGVTVNALQVAPILAAILAVFTVGLGLALKRGVPPRSGLAVLLAYMVLPLLVGLALFRLKPMFHPKYFMMASPAYLLLLGIAVCSFRRSLRWLAPPVGLFVVAALVYGVGSYFLDSRYWKDDTRAVGLYLDSRAVPQDLVIADLVEPLDYYYDGKAPAYYLPGDAATAPGRLAALVRDRKSVFLVHYEHAYTDPQGLIPFLLERASAKVEEKDFRGYSLDEYTLRPGAFFELGAGATSPDASFQGKLTLEGAHYGGEEAPSASDPPVVASDGRVWAELGWRLDAQADADYKASLSLVDSRGHLAAQKDSMILRGLDPTSRWTPGDEARNYYALPIYSGVEPGEYRLRLSVYAPQPTTESGGADLANRLLGDEVTLGKILVTAPRLAVEFAPQDMGTQSRAQLGPIDGLGYTISSRQYRPGDVVPLALFMRAPNPIQPDLRFRFEMMDGQGVSAWQWESSPQYPTSKWRSGDGVRDWQDVPLSARLAAGDYRLVVGLTPAAGVASESRWDLGTIRIVDRQRVFSAPPMSHTLQAEVGGKIALLGYDLDGDPRPGGTVKLTLYWQARQPTDQGYAVFAHLLDGQSHIWAQHDGTPGGDMPTSGWLQGEVVVDRHDLAIRSDAPPGEYVLEVGMYDPRTGLRLAASARDVQVVDQALWIQRVQVK
ncbi:MAG: glycosyltransferase family 39 protein [Dehalococcoidia bacterium]|nr:glycosyltransferase family 39 protein [Dehalococcoidia bacterium]